MDRSANSDTTTLSPTPFSPFSDARSFGSDNGTSDEPGDLGDFATVFRALNELRMPPNRSSNTMHSMFASAPASRARSRVRQGAGATPTTSTSIIPPDYDSEQDDDSDHDPEPDSQSRDPFDQYFSSLRNDIARARAYGEDYESSYRIDDTEDQSPDTRQSVISSYAPQPTSGDSEMDGLFSVDVDELSADDSQGSLQPIFPYSYASDLSAQQPTLGTLDDVFGFITSERAKFAATIDNRLQAMNNSIGSYGSGLRGRSRGAAGGASSTSESAWKHVVEPRRKRRRKRGKNSASASASASVSISASASASTTMLSSLSVAGPSSSGKSSRRQTSANPSTRVAEVEDEDAGADHLDEIDIIEGYNSSSEYEVDSFDVDADPLSSSPSKPYKPFLDSGLSSSSSPIRSRKGKTRGGLAANLNLIPHPTNQGRTSRLTHSRSTPSLRTAGLNGFEGPPGVSAGANATGIQSPSDSRVLKLRSLATKLRLWFPVDKQYLQDILRHSDSWISPDDFVDPRGRLPMAKDPLFHVFIDHSNILIGFINHLRRHAPSFTSSRRLKTHLSHAALSLILERGRPITRRVLATSSPLYQPMDGAEKLGYEVRVYARVPDTGDGMDRIGREKERATGRGRKGHTRKISTGAGGSGAMNISNGGGGSGGTSADSDLAGSPPSAGVIGPSPVTVSAIQIAQDSRLGRHGRNGSGATVAALQIASSVGSGGFSPGSSSAVASAATGNGTATTTTTTSSNPGARIRYREQGVDELLQLKLHQAIADSYESLPHGSTIILATGDGNVGQFNEDGFVGCVRTALRKGWRVELYAWEVGLSKAWTREFGKDEKFKIIFLEKYAADMLEVV